MHIIYASRNDKNEEINFARSHRDHPRLLTLLVVLGAYLGDNAIVLVLAMIGHVHVLRFAGQHIRLTLLDQFEALDTIPSSDTFHTDASLRGISEQFLAIVEVDLWHA